MPPNQNLEINSCSFRKRFPLTITKANKKELMRCDSYSLSFVFRAEKKHFVNDLSFSILVDDEVYVDPLTEKAFQAEFLVVNEPIEIILNLVFLSNSSYKKKITVAIEKEEITKSIYVQLAEPKIAIIPFFRKVAKQADIYKKQQYINDGVLSKDFILKEKIPQPNNFWHRRIVAFSDETEKRKKDVIPNQWLTSYHFGYPAKSIFCQLMIQGLTSTEKILLQLLVQREGKDVFTCKKSISSLKKSKIPIVEPKTPFAFSEEGFSKDAKTIAQFTVSDAVNKKLEKKIIFYNKSLIEYHIIESLAIFDHPFWNTIREQTFRIINKQLLTEIIKKGLKKPTYQDLLKNHADRFEEFGKMRIRKLCNYLVTEEAFLEKMGELSDKIISHFMTSFKEQIVHYTTKEGIILLKQRENLKLKNMIVHDFSQLFAAELTTNNKTKKEIGNIVNNFLDYLITF
jgi:hypothetical protein